MSRSGKLFNYWLNKNQAKNSKSSKVKTLALQSTIHDKARDNLGLIPQPSLKTLASTNTVKYEVSNVQGQPLGQDCDKNKVNAGSIIMKKIPQGLPLKTLAISCTNYNNMLQTMAKLLVKNWANYGPFEQKVGWTKVEFLEWTNGLNIWPVFKLEKGSSSD